MKCEGSHNSEEVFKFDSCGFVLYILFKNFHCLYKASQVVQTVFILPLQMFKLCSWKKGLYKDSVGAILSDSWPRARCKLAIFFCFLYPLPALSSHFKWLVAFESFLFGLGFFFFFFSSQFCAPLVRLTFWALIQFSLTLFTVSWVIGILINNILILDTRKCHLTQNVSPF